MTVLRVGDAVPELRLVVDVAHMKVFSLIMADPNPIHFDPEETARLGMGDRPINQGTLNLGYPVDALIALVGDPARIRRVRCRFLGSVVAGDEVMAGGRVTAVDGDRVTVEIWLDRTGAGRVLAGTAELDLG